LPRILWVQQNGQVADKQLVEQRTGLKITVSTGPHEAWRSIAHRIQVVVLELPLDAKVLEDTLAEAHNAVVPLPVVIYDKDGVLDESLVRPTMNFRHITRRLTAEELGDAVGAVLEETAGCLSAAAGEREPWQDLLIGESRIMRELHAMIRLVGPRQSTVLITGETGTGKEMIARALHMASKRSTAELVAVNCAAIPENLAEAELFGHAKGAFTSAVNHRVGRFEQAHRGTIFLDEIGEIPMEVQPKLLRVIQERELQRVGSSETVQLDTRVIAATNVDLDLAVEQKKFREDLLYRLNVVPIRVPPLRARAGDIPLLVEHFSEKICRREAFRPKSVSSSAMERLMAYHWPGNVRQLEHVIERAVSFAANRDRLYLGDIQLPDAKPVVLTPVPEIDVPMTGLNFEQVIGRVERLLIQEALRKCEGNKAKAARVLGLKRTTMLYKSKVHESETREAIAS
jgi:transcriptional regulator with GAF, ATPase, and Fis domain